MTRTLCERFELKFVKGKEAECWVWRGAKSGGYGWFFIHTGIHEYAHRVSYQLYKGDIPNGLCVLHRCDNPACVNPNHLFLGTQGDNVRDREGKGRGADHSGEKNGNAKLSAEQVIAIRKATHTRVRQLAELYNVNLKTIEAIRYGYSWKSVK